MAIEQGDVITTGKAKRLYATNDPELVWVQHLNQATALNGKRKAEIPEKAAYTNQISQLLFEFLNQAGIETHFVQRLSKTESLVQRLEMLPLEVVIRNYASGHFVSRFGVENMRVLEPNVLEFYFKSDALDDPFMNESQILSLRLADTETLVQIQTVAHQINQHLQDQFDEIDITLVDFKLEFGRTDAGQVILGDELSPDNMRLVDQSTGASLDKDIFRQNSGDLTIGYAQVLQRLQAKLGA